MKPKECWDLAHNFAGNPCALHILTLDQGRPDAAWKNAGAPGMLDISWTRRRVGVEPDPGLGPGKGRRLADAQGLSTFVNGSRISDGLRLGFISIYPFPLNRFRPRNVLK